MIGLVLEGGGARGSYHIGAVKALKKRKIKFDAVVGTSIGSINAAFVATNNLKTIEKLWTSVNSKEIFDIDDNILEAFRNRKITKSIVKEGFKTTQKIIKNRGIDLTHLKRLLKENLNEEKLRKSKIEYGLATYNISERKQVQIFKKEIPKGKLIEYIIASCYLPVFKFEKIIDEKYYLDGGVFDRCPIDMLYNKKEYKEIYVIKTFRNNSKYKSTKEKKVVIIKPKSSLGSQVFFNPKVVHYNLKLGYYDTLRALDNLDGKEYYFRKESNEFYEKLIDKNLRKKLRQKYGNLLNNQSQKTFIINNLEKACKDLGIKKFKVYSVSLLLLKIKILLKKDKNNFYYDFIKSLNT